MTILNFNVAELPELISAIPIGIRAENEVTQVALDFSAWAEEFGAGVVQLLLKRAPDTAPYPVVLTQSGSTAVWTATATDLAYKGTLLAEWLYTVGTQVKKSVVLRFYVMMDIGTAGSAPDPYESWLETLTGLASETQGNAEAAAESAESAAGSAQSAEDASDAIQGMDVEAETLEAGSAATVTKTVDPETGAVTLTFGIPRGQDGAGGAVESVNGMTGQVELSASDVGALPDDTAIPTASDASPQALGASASAGSSADFSRADHVHPKPTPADIGAGTYSKPSDGIPKADLASGVQTSLGKADTAYQKPSSGIPKTDLASAVQTSLGKADGALQKSGGTMSGAIAMGSNRITGLADGSADGDAVNLGQVAGLISTNTAFFRGSFATRAALLAVAWQTSDPEAANYVTNNDYAVVLDDESQNDECWRYVYVSGSGWAAQYRINEAPLTTAQAAALNSGATAVIIDSIAGKYVKPATGIPASDLASGVIPTVPAASTANPAALGTASPGSSGDYARGDHVHPKPSASDVGAIALPANPSSGQFLVYDGSAWTAMTLATWQGGSY